MKNLFKILIALCFSLFLLGCRSTSIDSTQVSVTEIATESLAESKEAVSQNYSKTETLAETKDKGKPDNQSVGDSKPQDASESIVSTESNTDSKEQSGKLTVTEDGEYSSKDEVALYIHLYGHLPSNYISKTKAKNNGWEQYEGNLWEVLPGKSIGGGPFGNNEGNLPEAEGREYKECDIDYEGGKRGPKRIVYSNDGLIFYTEDHYETFEQLY